MKKRFLAVLLLVAVIITCLPMKEVLAAETEQLLHVQKKIEDLHINKEDFQKRQQKKIEDLIGLAENGNEKIAEELNRYQTDTDFYTVVVNEVLDTYYENLEEGEISKEEIDSFTNLLDDSVGSLVQEYQEACEEREDEKLSYDAESIILQTDIDATEEEINAMVEDMDGGGYKILNDIDSYFQKECTEQEKALMERLKDVQTVQMVSVQIARRQTVKLARKEYQQYEIVQKAEKNGYCKEEPIKEDVAEAASTYSQTIKFTPYAKKAIMYDEAWSFLRANRDKTTIYRPRIAVIDSGFDIDHPDLCNMYTKDTSADITRIDPNTGTYMTLVREKQLGIPTYSDAHGTCVAGIIAAESGNGVGYCGLGNNGGWNLVELLEVKTKVGAEKYFEDKNIIQAILYSIAKGANVINMSIAADDSATDSNLQNVINSAYLTNVTVVAALGNNSKNLTNSWIASANHVIGVGSSDAQNKKANHSNYGAMLDLIAPGEDINILLPNGNTSNTFGTSLATPMVSAITGLLYFCGVYNPDHIEYILFKTCTDVYSIGYDEMSGYGIPNMYRAVQMAIDDCIEPVFEYEVEKYIFDSEFYARVYYDLRQAFGYNKRQLYNHWKVYGRQEGRVPGLLFDPVYYLNHNADVKAAVGGNYYQGFLHFVINGCHEYRTLSPIFSTRYYCDHAINQNMKEGMDVIKDFYQVGLKEGYVNTIAGFNVRQYAKTIDKRNIIVVNYYMGWKMYYVNYLLEYHSII